MVRREGFEPPWSLRSHSSPSGDSPSGSKPDAWKVGGLLGGLLHGLLQPRFAPLCQVRGPKKRPRASPTLTPCFLTRHVPKARRGGALERPSHGPVDRRSSRTRQRLDRAHEGLSNGSRSSNDQLVRSSRIVGSISSARDARVAPKRRDRKFDRAIADPSPLHPSTQPWRQAQARA
jgi:hypothetical protein